MDSGLAAVRRPGMTTIFRFHEFVTRKSEIFPCAVGQITGTGPLTPARPKGRIMIVAIRWAGMRWTQPASGVNNTGRNAWRRTAKSCGPGAATVASILREDIPQTTVTINAAHRGEHEVSRKAIARGKRTGKKYRYINAVRLQCSHLCRDSLASRTA